MSKKFDFKTKAAPGNLFKNLKENEPSSSSINKLISSQNSFDRGSRKGYITEIFIEHLVPFSLHPFRMYSQEKLEELAESIKQEGVLTPIIVRKKGEKYEILAGHNRTEAAKLAGLTEITARVIDVDDDEAKIIVTETNLKQREKLLPSEKAYAYKMQMEAIKNRDRKLKLINHFSSAEDDFEDLYQFGTKNSGEEVASKVNESRNNVYRYIRLTYLHKGLLEMVDSEEIPVNAGVEISYLRENEQDLLYKILCSSPPHIKIDISKASMLREKSKDNNLSVMTIEQILIGTREGKPKAHKEKSPYSKVFTKVQKYLKKHKLLEERLSDEEELEKIIIQAIERYIAERKDPAEIEEVL